MKGLAITQKGFEDICAREITELIKTNTTILDTCVQFDFNSLEDLCLLCYKAQSVTKILYLIDSVNYSSVEDLKQSTEKINFEEWVNKSSTFAVRCMQNINESTQDIESTVGEYIFEKTKIKVDLKNPDITFFIFINNTKAYFGIDFAGIDLSKRQYKIFQHPSALKGPIAYCTYRLGSDKNIILDPFCGSATILIEAALHRNKLPVNFYQKDKFAFLNFKPLKDFNFEKIDKEIIKDAKPTLSGFDHQLRYIKSAKNNAKIAGVEKQIIFSRVDIEWLDTKKDKETIDAIITNPPVISQHTNPVQIQKLYDEFFYHADFILKKDGKIVIISKDTETLKKIAQKKNFKVEHERSVWSGKQEYKIVIFSK